MSNKLSQVQLNAKHFKTIWHIRQTIWRWRKREGRWLDNPSISEFLSYMFKSGVIPRTREISEENNLLALLKDCACSGLVTGLDAFEDVKSTALVIPRVEVPWEVFLEERFN